MTRSGRPGIGWIAGVVVLVIAALAPLIFSDFYLNQILTKALWLGIVASSLIFLAAYGGMVSLAQTALFGVAGFTMANLVARGRRLVALVDSVGRRDRAASSQPSPSASSSVRSRAAARASTS